MAISDIANGESGASARAKINDSFTEANKIINNELVLKAGDTMTGPLIVAPSSSGATANSDADEFVVEGGGSSVGYSLLGTNTSTINFWIGNPSNNRGALVRWQPSSNLMTIGTNNSGADLRALSNSFSEGWRLKSNGNFLIGTTSDTGEKLKVNGDSLLDGDVEMGGGATADNFITTGGAQVNIQRLTKADAATVTIDCLNAEQTIVELTVNRAAMTLTIQNLGDVLHINIIKSFATDVTFTLTDTDYDFHDQQNLGLITTSLVMTRNNTTQKFSQIAFMNTKTVVTGDEVVNVNAQIT